MEAAVSQSLSKVLVHLIFSTKERFPFLKNDELRHELHKYLGGICNNLNSDVITIGGYYEHVHIFCSLCKNHGVSKIVMDLKRESSKWIKTKGEYLYKFGWQNGYGAFSIGQSQCDELIDYIKKQEEHHKKTFQEEYRAFLIKYKIPYNEKYVWD